MIKYLCLATALIFTAATAAQACFVAPDYLEGEFGSKDVLLDNVSEKADKIIIGRFRTGTIKNAVSFKPKKKIKPRRFFSMKKEVNLSFRNVSNNKIYLYEGKDNQESANFSELKNFIIQMRPSIDLDNIAYGTGGPIAGIHHGSDCERFVLLNLDQDYLVYLNSENIVLAKFPIKSISKDFIKGAPTLFARD